MCDRKRITVRDARRDEADAIARLLIMAWPVEDFLSMFPDMDEEAFAAFISGFVASEDNLYSHSLTKVAVLDDGSASGRVVGMMNGYDGALYEDLKKAVADRFDKEFPGSGEKFRGVSETGAGEFYLDSAGVDPQMRSMGIGSMLFEAMFARAKSEGFGTVGLIVDEDKPKAEALYRRLGFSVVGEKDFLGHKMKHMQKDLL